MDELDLKVVSCFPGMVVRKDITKYMKNGNNIPSFTLEYLLGMYCNSEDEALIKLGIEKIESIIRNNVIKPSESELIKSKIREKLSYTIIDRVSVKYDAIDDEYDVRFTNFDLYGCTINPDLVLNYEKLLVGGIWAIVKIRYIEQKDKMDTISGSSENHLYVRSRVKKSKSKFTVEALDPIQIGDFNLDSFLSMRDMFTTDEWIDLLIRTCGYEPNKLSRREKFHYLLRCVPFVQNNYNLIELGPRGTGKSHIYSELNPYATLISGGKVSSSTLFYNLVTHKPGLTCYWDTIAFDEVAGFTGTDEVFIQILKNYMANGSFSRGPVSLNATASLVFEGNTFKTLEDMLQNSTLFDPLANPYRTDTAFMDRLHAYLPGWEIPKLQSSYFTDRYALISDCFSEFCSLMRKFDFTFEVEKYFRFNKCFNIRDEQAVTRTFAGLEKLIYPNRNMTKEEARELLEYSIECRRRVKEQLRRLAPDEFYAVELGYIDNENNNEYIVKVPEEIDTRVLNDDVLEAGTVNTIGLDENNKYAIYQISNKKISGNGKFQIDRELPKIHYNSFVPSLSLLKSTSELFTNNNINDYDLIFKVNILTKSTYSDKINLAEYIGLLSALCDTSVKPYLLVYGKVSLDGSIIEMKCDIKKVLYESIASGAKILLLPNYLEEEYNKLSVKMEQLIKVYFYNTPVEAAQLALDFGGENE